MITDLKKQECLKILKNNYIGHMAYVYKNSPFIIPITYFYDKTNIIIIGYSGEGHKTNALRLNNAVAFEVSEITSVNEWRSILIKGTFEELSGPDAKFYLHEFSQGLKHLIAKKEKKDVEFIYEFSGKTHFEASPVVYRIKMETITGKQRKKPTTINAN
ncbi:pyridoxamine 5'-phosphate oxidase family protein [Algibacter sp.]|uniref:pyridoxamine 5'-phosphate oxidase family protein n=1 Tax=Algibacter sp. TaxID=1872428 RepID=UPI003C76904E